jgi:hypothetical protein
MKSKTPKEAKAQGLAEDITPPEELHENTANISMNGIKHQYQGIVSRISFEQSCDGPGRSGFHNKTSPERGLSRVPHKSRPPKNDKFSSPPSRDAKRFRGKPPNLQKP